MTKRKAARLLALLLAGMVSVLMCTSCGSTPEKTSSGNPESSSQPAAAQESSSRIDALVEAWNEAEINAQIKEKTSSSTLNSMYGCISQYTVMLDDEQFMVLEYDLGSSNSTAQRYLKFIDENGYDAKTDDPAWHNGEFLLRNTFSVLENGEVTAEFSVKDHPKSAQVLEAFQAFE